MGEPEPYQIEGKLQDYTVRRVSEAYRDLSFDAKIFYASKYGENVWSRTLVYSDGSPAAVGPDNKPLPETLVLDSTGNVVSYHGIPLHDMETVGFQSEGSWEQQQAKLKQIKKYTRKLNREERIEQNRVQSRQRYENQRKSKARLDKMDEGLKKALETERMLKAKQLKKEEAFKEFTDAAVEMTKEVAAISK